MVIPQGCSDFYQDVPHALGIGGGPGSCAGGPVPPGARPPHPGVQGFPSLSHTEGLLSEPADIPEPSAFPLEAHVWGSPVASLCDRSVTHGCRLHQCSQLCGISGTISSPSFTAQINSSLMRMLFLPLFYGQLVRDT